MSGGAAAWAFEVRDSCTSAGARELGGKCEFMPFGVFACARRRVQGVDEVAR